MKARPLKSIAWILIAMAFLGACSSGHHRGQQQAKSKPSKDETEQEAAEQKRRQEAIAAKQAADKDRFEKSLAVIRTVQPGDTYADFYHKASEARLSLERVTPIEDGREERFAFADNNTAFVIVVVKADHVRQITWEGIEH